MGGLTGGVWVGGQTGRVCRWVGGVGGWVDGQVRFGWVDRQGM